MNLLVTGGAGFIGSGFVHSAFHAGHQLFVMDSLTYAGNLANLANIIDKITFIKYDIVELHTYETNIINKLDIDAVINFAAESHVDRSIMDASPFVETNVKGTLALLDSIRKSGKKTRLVQISTDEVYGSADNLMPFTEKTPLKPNSPYAASKASADIMVQAYHHTYGLDTIITRCSNNYGPYQFPEKLIPLFITNLFEGKKVPVYGDGMQIRDWIHRDDHNRGILTALEKGISGEIYNFGGSNAKPNMEIVKELLKATGRDESFIQYVKDRPGHDRVYMIDYLKAATELKWYPQINFADGIKETVEWYKNNEKWWREIKSGEYMNYYNKQYNIR
jgi:dTDP-glucose 4,6-dehydratase